MGGRVARTRHQIAKLDNTGVGLVLDRRIADLANISCDTGTFRRVYPRVWGEGSAGQLRSEQGRGGRSRAEGRLPLPLSLPFPLPPPPPPPLPLSLCLTVGMWLGRSESCRSQVAAQWSCDVRREKK